MKELVKLRKMKPGLPIVVCGDMNSNRRSLVREYLLHGMPDVNKDGDLLLPSDGPFSAVWSREFNKKIAREPDGAKSTWKNDSYPWKHLWYNGADSPFCGKHADLVALRDAFEDLHDGKLAYTVPGEKNADGCNMLLDHMCVITHAPLQFVEVNFTRACRFHTLELQPLIGHKLTVVTSQQFFLESTSFIFGAISLSLAGRAVPQVQTRGAPSTQRKCTQRPLPLGHGLQICQLGICA